MRAVLIMNMVISKKDSLTWFIKKPVVLVFVVGCFVLSGCASTVKTAGKVAEVMYDPDIQVGPNEVQFSKVSLAVLSEDVLTTLSSNKRRGLFGSKIPANYYLLSLYELNQAYFNKTEDGILSANDALAIVDGKYLAKHQYYLKLNGYRFVKHFTLDEDAKGLLAVVNYQQPKCIVWSTVRSIKNIGEEYNFYLQGHDQGFILRSEQDVTAPGEQIKIDNRFLGQCEEQENAVIATVNMPMSNLVKSYMNAADQEAVEALVPNEKPAVAQKVNDNVDVLAKQSKKPVSQPKGMLASVVEDYEPAVNNTARAKPLVVSQQSAVVKPVIKSEYKPPTIVEDYEIPQIDNVKSKPKSSVKKAESATQVSDSVEQVQNVDVGLESVNLGLDSAVLEAFPFKDNEQGQRVYFLIGMGYIKTKGNALVVRSQPSVQSQKLSVIGDAKSLQVQRYSPSNGGWLYIESEGVQSGWVKESFVKWQLM